MIGRIALVLVLAPSTVAADTVVAARTLRAQTLITAADLVVSGSTIPGTYSDISAVVGQEARVALYAGRPIRPGDIGPQAIVDRNQIITLIYDVGTLRITAEGRALGRAGIGDRVRVMNLQSKSTVFGTVQANGSVTVSP